MLTVHHLAVSQSERVVWLCEEMGLDYDLVRYQREPTMAAPPGYKALHPAGAAPTVTDGDVALAETGAIFDYLFATRGTAGLVPPPDDPGLADYLFWLHFANGSMMPSLLVAAVLASLPVGDGNDFARAVMARADHGCAIMEAHLEKAPYLGGARFSAADIMMLFPLTTMTAFLPRDLSACPNIRGWIERVTDRPAYRRAMAKADPQFSRPWMQSHIDNVEDDLPPECAEGVAANEALLRDHVARIAAANAELDAADRPVDLS